MTKPSALELIETSFKYSYDRHFVTQFFCLLPYESIKFIYGSDAITNSPSGQALGLLTIVVWCGYGLMTTNQFYFLLNFSLFRVPTMVGMGFYRKLIVIVNTRHVMSEAVVSSEKFA